MFDMTRAIDIATKEFDEDVVVSIRKLPTDIYRDGINIAHYIIRIVVYDVIPKTCQFVISEYEAYCAVDAIDIFNLRFAAAIADLKRIRNLENERPA